MMYGTGTGALWIAAHMFLWLVLIVGLVVLAVWLVRGPADGKRDGTGESAVDILKKRCARGEISREEFERMKREIS